MSSSALSTFSTAAVAAAGLALALASGLHVYWMVGGHRGKANVIPTDDGKPLLRPTAATTLAVAALLAIASALYTGVAAEWQPRGIFQIGTAGAATILVLRAIGDRRSVGFTKRIKGTPFAKLDTTVLSPMCTMLALAGLLGVFAR